jgi:hypothetical protein
VSRRLALAAAVMLLLVMLLGCAAGESDSGEAASGADISATQTMSEGKTFSGARSLTEAEILDAYEQAAEAYSWFVRENMPCTGSTVDVNGVVFQRVQYDGISTLDELRTYLNGLFSRELTDQLMTEGENRYREIDGVLYATPFEVEPSEMKGKASLSVEQTDEDGYLVNVTVEILSADGKDVEGVECWAFPYEQLDGRWVFTSFDLAQ